MEPAFLSRAPGAGERLAALLFPASCVACGGAVGHARLGALCGSCWSSASWLEGAKGLRRGPAWHFDEACAAGAFEGPLREAIHAYKFGGKTAFRRPFLEMLAAMAFKADWLCWPPTASASLKERGFDSTAELARALAKKAGLPLYTGLRRSRQGEKQAGLGREKRWLNAKDAFDAPADARLKGRTVLLVDDVVTTGATLSECAAALKRGGALEVRCIALASGELRGN